MADTAEHKRLAEATGRAEDDLFNANPWYEWGPYLSERAWGTVREDYSADGEAWAFFPHDHASDWRLGQAAVDGWFRWGAADSAFAPTRRPACESG